MIGLDRRNVLVGALMAMSAPTSSAFAETLAGPALVRALRSGGYVIVMRHAASPRDPPSQETAAEGNSKRERQLDANGADTATDMGQALKALAIPIGDVWSSPTFRALQTARFIGLPMPRTADQLGDGGQNMQAAAASQSAWLRSRVAERPRSGTNTLLITHFPNISAAFGSDAAGVADGEALIFRPNGTEAELVARVKIEDWPRLAARP
jgi:phosphohistidine phosphatase SixA